MATFANVDELNAHLATRSYVSGYSYSPADRAAFAALSGAPNGASHPHAFRWAKHIAALSNSWLVAGPAQTSSSSAAPAAPAAKAAAADDDIDLFGDDDEETAEEKAANKARHQRMEAARKLKEEKDAKDGKVKSNKPKPVEKSLVVLEVKPWEADTDLKMVWGKIKEYQQEGLSWGETFKLEPVAYGIMKLVMTATIVDSLVVMDDVTENIEALEEWVQSVEVASMNKIS